jgi:hypothetical protein
VVPRFRRVFCHPRPSKKHLKNLNSTKIKIFIQILLYLMKMAKFKLKLASPLFFPWLACCAYPAPISPPLLHASSGAALFVHVAEACPATLALQRRPPLTTILVLDDPRCFVGQQPQRGSEH